MSPCLLFTGMLTTIHAYIETHRLLTADQPVVVGLSGGADSVALLAVLVRLGYTCVAAHCNFHLRGEESDRDERFAADMAKQLDVPFYQTDFDTENYAVQNHLSIEMAARELRYRWFEELRLSFNAQAAVVAHHRDDSVETLLMNLVRGTGIRGMSGIRPRNGYVVRPLLCVSRQEILDWLSEQQLSYVTDSTNLSDVYTRNFIRLRVLPLLEELNPSVKSAIARTSEHLSAAETIYLQVVEQARNEIMETSDRLSIHALMRYSEPDTILYELLSPFQVSRLQVHDIFLSLTKESGKEFFTSTYRLVKDRDYLLISPFTVSAGEESYQLNKEDITWSGPVSLCCCLQEMTDLFQPKKEKTVASFDYDKLRFPLVMRRWKKGDWFIPFGMKGRQKLSDYFTDHKFSLLQKEQAWLLCSGDDIIWIVGERTDNRYRIEKTTKQVFILKIS